jgi:hypothetical protein
MAKKASSSSAKPLRLVVATNVLLSEALMLQLVETILELVHASQRTWAYYSIRGLKELVYYYCYCNEF